MHHIKTRNLLNIDLTILLENPFENMKPSEMYFQKKTILKNVSLNNLDVIN